MIRHLIKFSSCKITNNELFQNIRQIREIYAPHLVYDSKIQGKSPVIHPVPAVNETMILLSEKLSKITSVIKKAIFQI